MKSFLTLLSLSFLCLNLFSQNVGIETPNPKSKLHLGAGDIFLQNNTQGIILKSPNGICWKLGVNNSGQAVFSSVTCPDWQCGDVLIYDGEEYNTVLIGTQCWMAENLNVGTMIAGINQTNNSIIEKYCYENNPINCSIYGGLYQWDESMQYNTAESVQGVCPLGWHLPSLSEWNMLINSLPSPDKASRLAGDLPLWQTGALTSSNFFNTTGFIGKPGGLRIPDGIGVFDFLSEFSIFWTSSIQSSNNGMRVGLFYFDTSVNFGGDGKLSGLSVRCVKN